MKHRFFPRAGLTKAQAQAIQDAYYGLTIAANLERRSLCIPNARMYARDARSLLAAFCDRMTVEAYSKREMTRMIARISRRPSRRRKKRKARA